MRKPRTILKKEDSRLKIVAVITVEGSLNRKRISLFAENEQVYIINPYPAN